jgi:hypothetical protein
LTREQEKKKKERTEVQTKDHTQKCRMHNGECLKIVYNEGPSCQGTMVFNKIKAKCGKVHLTIFNMANSSFQGRISCTEG